MPSITGIFPRIIYSEQLKITDSYNDEIKREIINTLNNDKSVGSITDSRTTFFSNSNNPEHVNQILDNPVFAPLFSMIKENVEKLWTSLNLRGSLKICNMWFSISDPGQCHAYHKHPGSVLSGVYYVQASPSMELTFISDGPIDYPDHNEKLNSKKLILFDSGLIHGFTPVKQDEEQKITISFNYKYSF